MDFRVVTIFPEMIHLATSFGVLSRALSENLVKLKTFNPRDYTHDKHRSIDDRPFGGGPGMVMLAAPMAAAINAAAEPIENRDREKTKVVYLSPHGIRFDHQLARRASNLERLVFVCGRYEGVDQRLIDSQIDEEWSLGDFVLSGGELAAISMIEAISRLLPNTLGNAESAANDSFYNGLLDFPHYTRPQVYEDKPVPEVLLSGDHSAIECWRMKQALGRTWLLRPDLLDSLDLNADQGILLDEFKIEYNQRTAVSEG